MAINAIAIDCETEAGTLDRLTQAIDARSKAMRATTGDSIVAAANMILRSLKSRTPKASRKVVEGDYKIRETDMFGGWKGKRICARIGSHAGKASHIRPAIWLNNRADVMRARVYAIYSSNKYDRFERNVNAPAKCWYVLAISREAAVTYAKARIGRILSKERGMAKSALAVAQAKCSTRGNLVSKEQFEGRGGMSQRAASIAYEASKLSISDDGGASGVASVDYEDSLRYSLPAAGGKTALVASIEAASRALMGAYGGEEMRKVVSNWKMLDPTNEVYEVLRRSWAKHNAMSAHQQARLK